MHGVRFVYIALIFVAALPVSFADYLARGVERTLPRLIWDAFPLTPPPELSAALRIAPEGRTPALARFLAFCARRMARLHARRAGAPLNQGLTSAGLAFA